MLTIEAKKQKVNTWYSREQFELLMECSAKRNMTEWNEWRENNPERPVLLQNAHLEKAYLRGADLHEADFRGASLRGADLSGAKLFDFSRRWADLSGADFSEADLCGTDFRGADLSGANFRHTYLFYTNLSWTNLSGANFSGADLWAILYEAKLTSVDLNQANRRLSEFTRIGCKYIKKTRLSAPHLLILNHDSELAAVTTRQKLPHPGPSIPLKRAV
ncbi:MAG: pentapeptide repeat-containing protein [Desulfobulbus sp.]